MECPVTGDTIKKKIILYEKINQNYRINFFYSNFHFLIKQL